MSELPTPTVRCPVCASPITAEDAPRVCERCDTPHHQDCWDYVGHCAVFGCHVDETRPALAEGELASLRTSLDRWLWTYRAYAICMAAIGPALACFFFSTTAGQIVATILRTNALAPLFDLVLLLSGLAFLGFGVGVLLFGLPMLWARRRLSSLLSAPAPRQRVDRHALLARLELHGLSGWIFRRINALGRLVDWLVLGGKVCFGSLFFALVFLPIRLPPHGIEAAFLFVATLGILLGVFCAGPLHTARERLAYLATVQNRSVLGWKGKG